MSLPFSCYSGDRITNKLGFKRKHDIYILGKINIYLYDHRMLNKIQGQQTS